LQKPIRQSGFAVVDVSDDAEISNVFQNQSPYWDGYFFTKEFTPIFGSRIYPGFHKKIKEKPVS